MRIHFTPTSRSKFLPKGLAKAFKVQRGLEFDPIRLRVLRFERPDDKAFLRKQRVQSANRSWAINAAHLGSAFEGHISQMSQRTGFVRRLLESPEDRSLRLAQELEEWKTRYLANQRYLVPRLHPKNMVRLKQMFTGTVGTLVGVNVITDAFVDS